MLKSLPDSILSLVYPQECYICRGEVEFSDDGVACSGCWNATKIFTGGETLCNKCGAFLFGTAPSNSAFCRKCDDHAYDRAFATGLYEKALSISILHLKKTPHLSGRVRSLLAGTLERITIERSTFVVPVPLSSRRLHERGFNQAAIIGKSISKYCGFPFDESSLIRKVHTPMHRAGMDRKARALTVRNAFEVARPKLLEDRHILLVDDIFTSGETASTCARILKKSGAATVNVLTIAHTA